MRWPSKRIAPSDGPQHARDGLLRRRLAGAVGAEQRDDLAGVGVERDALERPDRAVADLDVVDLDQAEWSCVWLPGLVVVGIDEVQLGLRRRPASAASRSDVPR